MFALPDLEFSILPEDQFQSFHHDVI